VRDENQAVRNAYWRRRRRAVILRAVVSYGQYCPVAKAAQVLGDRWTLLIVRDLILGASGFNELARGLPGISRSVLAQRMRTLERAGVVERRMAPGGRTLGYRLTPAGRDLVPVVNALGEWGATWAFGDPLPDELDPGLLIAWIARHANPGRLPAQRTLLQFDFRAPPQRFWLVLAADEISVCLEPPGFDVDLTVRADTAALYQVYLGRATLQQAVSSGGVDLVGPARLQRAFGTWFTWSGFRPAMRDAPGRRAAVERATWRRLHVSVAAGSPAATGIH
jgi:DNA-binding HxlR family transcriptional regulator